MSQDTKTTTSTSDNEPPQQKVKSYMKTAVCENDYDRLDIIKDMNGFSEQDMQNPERIERIEMVLEDFGRMGVISKFKNLKTLILINQGITEIEGLDECYFLQSLWLNENKITKIEGIENCKSLKQLHLSNNKISKIEGLSNLTELEILWLNENQITAIEGLDSLTKLKQLWIAGNQIESIRNSLDKLTSLSDLNLSSNKICSFKEVLNLTRLPNLRILSFFDPHYGDNPICMLGNYQTYVLYHLSGITQLDTLWVSENARTLAETTFMKKKMYYNMKIKTILRCFSSVIRLMKRAKKVKLDMIYSNITNAQKKITFMTDIKNKKYHPDVKELNEYLVEKGNELQYTEELHKSLKRKVYDLSKQYIHKLMTELDTGGNIRLEEGSKDDKWYLSCIDLLKSRFHPEEMIDYNIKDIEIKRIIRIHNRFLKNKFEDRLESLVDMSNNNYKKAVEYLFYGMDPKAPQEIFRIIEEGYRGANESQNIGLCPYPPLVNTILAADLPRITSHLNNNKLKDKYKQSEYLSQKLKEDIKLTPPGYFLICKVLILKGKYDSMNPYFDLDSSPTENYYKNPINSSLYTSETSIFRLKEGDAKHKLWFILDGALVQPEFLVEFDYVHDSQTANKICDFGDLLGYADGEEFLTANNMSQYKENLEQLYSYYYDRIKNHNFDTLPQNNLTESFETLSKEIQRADIPHIKPLLINYLKFATAKPMVEKKLKEEVEEIKVEKLKELNEATIKKQVGDYDATSLAFPIRDIQVVSGLDKFKKLQYVNLSFNNISELNGIKSCTEIEVLDISYNKLTNVECLHSLPKLCKLYLQHNLISKTQDLYTLKFNNNMKELTIRGNPVTFTKNYKFHLLQLLTQVQILDGKKITDKDKQDVTEKYTVLDDELIIEYSRIQQTQTTSLIKEIKTNEWKTNVETLNLSHLRIKKITSLEGLVNLQQANFSHNLIEKIEGLDNCTNLEELNLEKNKITKIEGLDKLVFLKKLELGKNKITTIENLDHLENLNQLSLEDNQIEVLKSFPLLKNLMELYLGNNHISDIKQVKFLGDLPKTIILDISGNPMTKEPNYRIFILYNMKKLKVLDGISIESGEIAQAKETYTGRLTEELLESRLNGMATNEIKLLDLSNSKLRDFDDMFNNSNFPHLRELNLSNNLFQTLKCIGQMPHLRLLNLSANRIESLIIPGMNILDCKKGLNGLHNLEALDISYNQLKDFGGLQFSQLKELRLLRANNNEITKIEYLDNLIQLKELNVNHNKIRQFDGNSFSSMNSIKCLKIDDNGLRNFSNIQKLYKLHHLFANSNRISDFPDIDRLVDLPYLKELELSSNPVVRKPGYRSAVLRKLPLLLYLDGKEISQEERERSDQLVNYPEVKMAQPLIYVQSQMPSSKVPVKLTAVNFETVFNNIRGMSEGGKK